MSLSGSSKNKNFSPLSAQAVAVRNLASRATPLALVLVALGFMVVHKVGILPVERLRIAVTDAVTPVLSAVTAPFQTWVGSFDGIQTLRGLKAENIRLKQENEKLHAWYEQALRMQAENNSLRELLNVKADASISYVTTRIVSDPGGSFVKSVLLPVGESDGIRKGSAVMSGKGLIGRVTEVGRNASRVLLVSDLNSRIPVLIQNTRTKAVLAGKNTDMLKLERLPIDSGLAVGQRIVTSGDGGQIPADIPIGTIVAIDKDGVTVKPLADIHAATHVQVINAEIDQTLITGDITQ